MPEENVEKKSCRVTAENLNDKGFRILTSGLNWDDFDNNPVMPYNHLRVTDSWDKVALMFPIGRWENRRVQNGEVLLDPVFNEGYEYGAQVKQMWEDGFLNTASISIQIIEWSEDPALMLPGQSRPTITKAKVKEVSITDIPGNPICHKLTYGDNVVNMNADNDDALNGILPILKSKNKSGMNVELIAATLGLEGEVSEVKLVGKITELKNTHETLTARNTTLEAENKAFKLQLEGEKVAKLVGEALTAGKITETQKPIWEKLASENYESTKAALDGMAGYTAPTTVIERSNLSADANETLVARYKELDRNGKLSKLPEAEREMLVAAYIESLHKSGKVK